MDIFTDIRKREDIVKTLIQLAVSQTHQGRFHAHIFHTTEVRLKAGTKLQHGGNFGMHHDTPLGRLNDTCQNLEQGGFAGAIFPDNTQGLAANHVQVDVIEHLGTMHRCTSEQQRDKCLQAFT